MNKIRIFIVLLLLLSCGQKNEKPTKTTSNQHESIAKELKEKTAPKFNALPSSEKIQLTKPTVVIVQMDSLEFAQAKKIDGEDSFYTALDDLMWYDAMMLEKMDSLRIAVRYTDKDTVTIHTVNLTSTIIKDTTFYLHTYFYFDGKEIKRTELSELIGE